MEQNEVGIYEQLKAKDITTTTNNNNNNMNYNLREDVDVLYFDTHAMSNVLATHRASHSYVEWHPSSLRDVKINDDLSQFQTTPLSATVDRRPIVARQQMSIDDLHSDGRILGCALTGTTFVSNLEYVSDTEYFESKNRHKEYKLPVLCDVCFQFASRQDVRNFVPSVGYEPIQHKEYQSSTGTKYFGGTAKLRARFPHWQRGDARFKGYGYPWTVDCTLPNGIRELTCAGITKLHDDNQSSDKTHNIYYESKFSLDGYFSNDMPKTFTVVTQWEWDAVKSHDDERKYALTLPKSFDDSQSDLTPAQVETLKLAHVEGPGHTKTILENNQFTLESMEQNPNSFGGVHKRFVTNLFHLIRNAPNSSHILAVVDGQALRSLERMRSLLNAGVVLIWPKYGNDLVQAVMETSTPYDYISVNDIVNRPNKALTQTTTNIKLKTLLRR